MYRRVLFLFLSARFELPHGCCTRTYGVNGGRKAEGRKQRQSQRHNQRQKLWPKPQTKSPHLRQRLASTPCLDTLQSTIVALHNCSKLSTRVAQTLRAIAPVAESRPSPGAAARPGQATLRTSPFSWASPPGRISCPVNRLVGSLFRHPPHARFPRRSLLESLTITLFFLPYPSSDCARLGWHRCASSCRLTAASSHPSYELVHVPLNF
ncbi:hypothetical protein V8C35DRAFT_100720 [Trichoderma chlorosporum]